MFSIKSLLAKPVAQYTVYYIQQQSKRLQAIDNQEKTWQYLIKKARDTQFGRDHRFDKIRTYTDFKQRIPLRDYEGFRPYINLIMQGENDVLWRGKPLYFAKTSGTTSGTKYIPITKESIKPHIQAAKNSLLTYIFHSKNARFLNGKMVYLTGSPILEQKAGILTGRMSGISNHYIPSYLNRDKIPHHDVNCIEDWEQKVDAIIDISIKQDVTLVAGIPSWIQMFFDRLIARTKQPVCATFPNFSVLVHGGVNFEPYRAKMEASIEQSFDTIEVYAASEGFLAYRGQPNVEGMLLNTNAGMFFEFVPADEIFDEQPTRLSLAEIELGVNYAIIINSNAGLWGYRIGDTVKFVSLDPFRILVTGRTKHFISAFGEHVIGEEVAQAIRYAADKTSAVVSEFTVAPMVSPAQGLPYHEWFIEFAQLPDNQLVFAQLLDEFILQKNSYYADLRVGNILQNCKVRPLAKGAFRQYMKSIGKLGGQHKVPQLANNRKIAVFLKDFLK